MTNDPSSPGLPIWTAPSRMIEGLRHRAGLDQCAVLINHPRSRAQRPAKSPGG